MTAWRPVRRPAGALRRPGGTNAESALLVLAPDPTTRLTSVGVAVALAVPLTTVAMAANPGAGTVGPGSPTQTWEGKVYVAAATPGPCCLPGRGR